MLLQASLTRSFLLPLVTANDCILPNNPTYTGYSLAQNTACSKYVQCVNGAVVETIACPIGTLYNGDVGVGGVCDWADLVTCAEGSEGSTTVMPVGTETIEVDAITTVPTVATIDSSGNGESVASTDNPNNFYCGSSNQDASQMCLPCPSGANSECADSAHVCFAGITCASTTEAAAVTPTLPATTTTTITVANNYYCGSTLQEAGDLCIPCPSGSFMDCITPGHGCFAVVDACTLTLEPTTASDVDIGAEETTGYATDLASKLEVNIEMNKNFDHDVDCTLGDWGLCYTKTLTIDYAGDLDYVAK